MKIFFVIDYTTNNQDQFIVYEVQKVMGSDNYYDVSNINSKFWNIHFFEKIYKNRDTSTDLMVELDSHKEKQRAIFNNENTKKYNPPTLIVNRPLTNRNNNYPLTYDEINKIKNFYKNNNCRVVIKGIGCLGSANIFCRNISEDDLIEKIKTQMQYGPIVIEKEVMLTSNKYNDKYTKKNTDSPGVYRRDVVCYDTESNDVEHYEIYKKILNQNITTDSHSNEHNNFSEWKIYLNSNLNDHKNRMKGKEIKHEERYKKRKIFFKDIGESIHQYYKNMENNHRDNIDYGYYHEKFNSSFNNITLGEIDKKNTIRSIAKYQYDKKPYISKTLSKFIKYYDKYQKRKHLKSRSNINQNLQEKYNRISDRIVNAIYDAIKSNNHIKLNNSTLLAISKALKQDIALDKPEMIQAVINHKNQLSNKNTINKLNLLNHCLVYRESRKKGYISDYLPKYTEQKKENKVSAINKIIKYLTRSVNQNNMPIFTPEEIEALKYDINSKQMINIYKDLPSELKNSIKNQENPYLMKKIETEKIKTKYIMKGGNPYRFLKQARIGLDEVNENHKKCIDKLKKRAANYKSKSASARTKAWIDEKGENNLDKKDIIKKYKEEAGHFSFRSKYLSFFNNKASLIKNISEQAENSASIQTLKDFNINI